METLELLIGAVVVAITLISSVVGFIISLAKSIKNARRADNAEATNEIENMAIDKIAEVEKLYFQASQILKSVGIKTGEIKKENVMNFIETQCVEKGMKFDEAYWSEQVENIVNVMNVNKE